MSTGPQPPPSPPTADGNVGLTALRALWRERTPLAALKVFHQAIGDVFAINVPAFRPVVVAGPTMNRHLLVDACESFLWRSERDAVTDLLRHGVLVTDGAEHDRLRAEMQPFMQRSEVARHVPVMVDAVDTLAARWTPDATVDMLVEMRKLALDILMRTLFDVDIRPDLGRIWQPLLGVLRFISPGLWLIWSGAPRPGSRVPRAAMDAYLYRLIQERRRELVGGETERSDMLTHLLANTDWSDDLVRDQMLTMLIAGHDTSTALLAWALWLLGRHPDTLAAVTAEVDAAIGRHSPTATDLNRLPLLDAVIKETLRLYPPIHVGNRRAAADLELGGYHVPQGTRVMVSFYASHRDPEQWDDPDAFKPERFLAARPHGPLAYVPFGAGPRNCIGAQLGRTEAKVALARLLQTHTLTLKDQPVHEHMGATLEPRPGVSMRVSPRAPDLN